MFKLCAPKGVQVETLVISDNLPLEAKDSFPKYFIETTFPKWTRKRVVKYIKNMLMNHQTHNDFILLNSGEYAKRNVERLVLYYMFCANKLSIRAYKEHMAFFHHAELYLPDSLHPVLSMKKMTKEVGAVACHFKGETAEMIKQVGTIYLDDQNLFGRAGISHDELNDLYNTIMDPKHPDCYKALWLDVATDSNTELGGLVSKGPVEMRRKFQIASSLMTKKIVTKFLENDEFSFMVSILAAHNPTYSWTSSSAEESIESPVKGMNMPSVEQNVAVNQDKKCGELPVSESNVFSNAAYLPGGFLESTGMQSTQREDTNVSQGEPKDTQEVGLKK